MGGAGQGECHGDVGGTDAVINDSNQYRCVGALHYHSYYICADNCHLNPTNKFETAA